MCKQVLTWLFDDKIKVGESFSREKFVKLGPEKELQVYRNILALAQMASSLEELLAEEGFKGRSSRTSSRSSFKEEILSMPHSHFNDQSRRASFSSNKSRTERARSNVSEYALRGELPRIGSIVGRRPRDNLIRREMVDGGSMKEHRGRLAGRGSNEIVEVGVGESERIENIYSDEVNISEMKETYSKAIVVKERYKGRSVEDIKAGQWQSNSFNQHLLRRDSSRKSMKQTDSNNDRSYRGSQNRKRTEDTPPVSEPALDEVAVQAMVSILTGYIKRFLKDEDFRTTLHHTCFSSLNNDELEEENNNESKVISNLEQAIETVERAAEESVSVKELKKASLQLSVITGLNSNDLKDGFTSGVPNSKLSACAHLYLGVIYKLQKKDRISAKHLLQVFCDSPFLARTTLLPELWDYLFSPHLSHLKVWYNQEADSLTDEPNRLGKLKLLEKAYSEIVDSGTYQFAVYYKDWLTEGVEAPSIPSIQIPPVSVRILQKKGSHGHSSELASPASPFSPKPMVSKKLYDAVFRRLSKPRADDAEDDGETENYENYTRSSDGSVVEVKHALTYISEIVKCTSQDIEEGSAKSAQDDICHTEDVLLLTAEGEGTSPAASIMPEGEIGDISKNNTGEALKLLSPPCRKVNELTLNRLAKSIFKWQRTECASDLTISSLPSTSETPFQDSLANPMKVKPSFEELQASYEYIDEGSFFASIPQDFICPLIGQLFEDPVTLETGQTFEREAIKEWMDKGNATCPVTGKTLECLTVPVTNFILKRLIDGWKSENFRHLLAFASHVVENSEGDGSTNQDELAIYILEQLFSTFSCQDRITNAKHLISIGGLQFFIQRFDFGKLDEKTRSAALLSSCIEADAGCRNHIAKHINKRSLLELLHSKQVKSRIIVVSLLTELICFTRQREVPLLLSGLPNEEILNAMHVLLLYLQSSPPEKRPLLSVLLLHLDFVVFSLNKNLMVYMCSYSGFSSSYYCHVIFICHFVASGVPPDSLNHDIAETTCHMLLQVEPKKFSMYREAAVDAITMALDESLTDEKVREQCCRALIILGGRFSFSGELITESWILSQAGLDDGCEVNSPKNKENNLLVDDFVTLDEEEHACEEWLNKVSASLLGNGNRSFLKTISKILVSGDRELVRVCLTTVAWLSRALSSIPDAEFQLRAFSALISVLKERLKNSEQLLHKILASMSLLNFSKIPECMVFLMAIADDIKVPLQSLAEVTSTAKQLYTIISMEDL
ncbi:hypothetical protein Dsin_019084 [Dipteronia sinensis]|uniref:RING-type E3 ubiquitin transferase n=1 Tax=Dipteronia sinensis TaxID=43782 RepID=A0AAE0A7Y8_9ROSI|nr:hypothetical protein Dsin_019084 [Dipteronia sinensis]